MFSLENAGDNEGLTVATCTTDGRLESLEEIVNRESPENRAFLAK
jgi:hypothetical protein